MAGRDKESHSSGYSSGRSWLRQHKERVQSLNDELKLWEMRAATLLCDLAGGWSFVQIAERLNVSEATAKRVYGFALEKYGAINRPNLIHLARKDIPDTVEMRPR